MNSTLARTLIRLLTAVVLKMQIAGNTYCEQQPCKRKLSNLPEWHIECHLCLYYWQWTELLFKHHGEVTAGQEAQYPSGWMQVANNTAWCDSKAEAGGGGACPPPSHTHTQKYTNTHTHIHAMPYSAFEKGQTGMGRSRLCCCVLIHENTDVPQVLRDILFKAMLRWQTAGQRTW